MCNCEDVSKKGDEIGKLFSEHQRRLLLICLLSVHVLVKLGGRCGSRCRLLN